MHWLIVVRWAGRARPKESVVRTGRIRVQPASTRSRTKSPSSTRAADLHSRNRPHLPQAARAILAEMSVDGSGKWGVNRLRENWHGIQPHTFPRRHTGSMDSAPGGTWGRSTIGWLALIGGLCMAAGILWPRLGGILYLVAAPALILGAGVILALGWRNPDLDRWGRAVCACGVAAYLVFIVALIACGDIEGGIPVGAQAFWQAASIAAMMVAVPLLIFGGARVLTRRRHAHVVHHSHAVRQAD